MCSGYLVQVDRDRIIFDHGFGAHHRLLQLGVNATQVTHAFFSHHHYDHIGDYARLLLTRWDQGAGRIEELQVYGPTGMEHITRRLIADDGVFGLDLISRTKNQASIDVYRARGGVGERLPPKPRVRELQAGQKVQGEGWSVSVVEVNHFAPHLTSLGYRLEAEGQSFVYSGDTGPSRALAALATNCDVLVHMCHYLSGTAPSKTFAAFTMSHMELAELAQAAKVRNLVISHVTAQFDRPGMRERVILEIGRVFTGNVFFGEDLMEIPFSAPEALHLD
ncbi:MAG: MBL fold metallo-hydrolase [Betaproteobacteria bacterium]